jgi:hypothetical protein
VRRSVGERRANARACGPITYPCRIPRLPGWPAVESQKYVVATSVDAAPDRPCSCQNRSRHWMYVRARDAYDNSCICRRFLRGEGWGNRNTPQDREGNGAHDVISRHGFAAPHLVEIDRHGLVRPLQARHDGAVAQTVAETPREGTWQHQARCALPARRRRVLPVEVRTRRRARRAPRRSRPPVAAPLSFENHQWPTATGCALHRGAGAAEEYVKEGPPRSHRWPPCRVECA